MIKQMAYDGRFDDADDDDVQMPASSAIGMFFLPFISLARYGASCLILTLNTANSTMFSDLSCKREH